LFRILKHIILIIMNPRVVVLGAGFGGLELCSVLSETMGDRLDITLTDKSDSFYFGFSKLDVMFGKKPANSVLMHYGSIVKPGVKFRRETITSIDPVNKRITTNSGVYEADILVVALGADYDLKATPGLAEGGNEFYSFTGAEKLREVLPAFTTGHAIVGVCSAPFKCPPAPSEAALLLHDYLTKRGVRDACTITLVIPFRLPIPPSPDTSRALLRAFADRKITYESEAVVVSLDPARKIAVLNDGSELPCDLFLGIPKHVAPEVVLQSGMTENGWIPVERNTLKTKFPGVYAIGDVTSVGTPKAGVFAEGSAKIAAASILADLDKTEHSLKYKGDGSCYVEFGQGKVGRIDIDFFSGPTPHGTLFGPTEAGIAEKEYFGSSRKARWFGIE
jgi:sulfide:quinone oxidoreductase